MSKIADFFKPRRLGFHLVLAIVLTFVIICIVNACLKHYTRNGVEAEMPNYVGRTSAELLESHNEDYIFIVRNTVVDKSKHEGTIIAQEPIAGERVKKGRKVFLTISTLVPHQVRMPQVTGDHGLRQATNILESAGLILENVVYVESETPGQVVAQYYKNRPIKPGTMIDEGSKITLHIGAEATESTDEFDDEFGDAPANNIEF